MSEMKSQPQWTPSQRFRKALMFAFISGCFLSLGINSWHSYQRGFNATLDQLQRDVHQEMTLSVDRFPLANNLLQWISKKSVWVEKGAKHEGEGFTFIDHHFSHRLLATHKDLIVRFKNNVTLALLIVWMTLKMMGAKLLAIAISTLLFVFAGAIGALDGLLSRYIRTIEAGRESTFIFHKISNTLLKLPPLLLFVYLVSPGVVGSEFFIVGIALSLFYFFYVLMAHLKKFL